MSRPLLFNFRAVELQRVTKYVHGNISLSLWLVCNMRKKKYEDGKEGEKIDDGKGDGIETEAS